MTDKIDLIAETRLAVRQYLQHMDDHQARNLYDAVIHEIEKALIMEVLDHSNGNLTNTSKILGITRTTLRNKCRKHKI